MLAAVLRVVLAAAILQHCDGFAAGGQLQKALLRSTSTISYVPPSASPLKTDTRMMLACRLGDGCVGRGKSKLVQRLGKFGITGVAKRQAGIVRMSSESEASEVQEKVDVGAGRGGEAVVGAQKGNLINALYKFTRPHTIRGTILASCACVTRVTLMGIK